MPTFSDLLKNFYEKEPQRVALYVLLSGQPDQPVTYRELLQGSAAYARAFEQLVDRLTWNFMPIMVRLAGVTIVLSTIEIRLAFIVLGWALFYIFINYFTAFYLR